MTGKALPARPLLPVLALAFAVCGVSSVMLGPALPFLIRRWSLPDAQAGFLFAAMFLGNVTGALLAPLRTRASIIAGGFLLAVGASAFGAAGASFAPFALFVQGTGTGLLVTAGNVLAGDLWRERRASVLSLLNFCWSVGAILCPVLLRTVAARTTLSDFLYGLALVALPVSALSFVLSGRVQRMTRLTREAESTPAARGGKPNPVALFALALLLFVGAENAIGGWLPVFVQRVLHASAATPETGSAAWIVTVYWAAEAAGRLLVTPALLWMPEWTLLRVSLWTALGGVTALLTSSTVWAGGHLLAVLLGASIVCGAAMGPVFPLMISLLLAGSSRRRSLGWVFASCGLGAALLPWVTGIVSTAGADLRLGFGVPAAALLLLILTVWRLTLPR